MDTAEATRMSKDTFYEKIGEMAMKEIIAFLDHNQTELTIKINGQYVKANVNYIKNQKSFSILRFNAFDFANEPVLCSFQKKDDLYFFNSYLSSSKLDYTIEIPKDIFHLQRRNDFRVTVPTGVQYKCTITAQNGIFKSVPAELRDLSMAGCQIAVPAYQLETKKDDVLDVKLEMDSYEFNRIELTARHVKYFEDQNLLLIGCSFKVTGEEATDLRAVLMYLDRTQRGKE